MPQKIYYGLIEYFNEAVLNLMGGEVRIIFNGGKTWNGGENAIKVPTFYEGPNGRKCN